MSTEDALRSVRLSDNTMGHQAEASMLLQMVEGILHASLDPMYVVDRQGRFVHIGEAGANLLGVPASEIIGRTVQDFGFAPQLAADLGAWIERVFRTKQPLTGTTLIPAVEGLHSYEHHCSPLFDPEGEVTAVLCVTHDITSRKAAELALREKEAEVSALNADLQRRLEEVEAIFQTVPVALNIAEDAACTKIRGNAVAYRMLRLPDGANISKTGPPDEQPGYRVFRDGQEIAGEKLPMQVAACTGQQVSNVEVEIVFEDGAIRHWYGGASPLFDEQGATRGSVGAFMDITPLKSAQEEITRLNERLHRAIYETSHRVKNQLQVLTATADMVLMDNEQTISAGALRRLRSQIGAIALTHDLLTNETRANATTDHISLKALLERMLAALQQTSGDHQLRASLAEVHVPLKIATSVALLLNESVSNAIKHGRGEVEVKLEVAAGQGRLEVCDDGDGFPAGFDARRAANTGLELVLTLARIDLGGTVEFTNRAAGGARVIVAFPLLAKL